MRIAAIADLHCRVGEQETLQKILEDINQEADVLILAGDLTDNGLPAELEILLAELGKMDKPVIAVLGNHDHEGGRSDELTQMLDEAGVHVLEGTAIEIDGVGFGGTKGFCGGFEKQLIQPFGESALKKFIKASIDEAVNLENALAKLNCDYKIAVLHYSPIKATLEGESSELFPFLGCSRLENALDRQGVNIAVHGHAHHGSPSGLTAGNVPVHNVSRFVQSQYNGKPYCIFEV
jgi:Icc-related predicted phosphoesterase